MSKISPCLWFDGQAEEAAQLYTSLVPDSRIDSVNRAPADYPSGSAGDVLTVEFTLAGESYIGLNGGPHFKFTEAVSFTIHCGDQAEVDYYWDALTADGGAPSQCGWLKDRFGLSWQIVPRQLIPESQRDEIMQEYGDSVQSIVRSGHYLAGAKLLCHKRCHNPVVRSSWQSVVEELRTQWIPAGLDLLQPFQVAWYNRAVANGFRLPDFGRPSALEILVANTRAIWTALPRRLAREPARARRAQPARELLEAAVLPALQPLTCCSEVRMGAGSPAAAGQQRLAHVSGLAYLKWCLMRPFLRRRGRSRTWFLIR